MVTIFTDNDHRQIRTLTQLVMAYYLYKNPVGFEITYRTQSNQINELHVHYDFEIGPTPVNSTLNVALSSFEAVAESEVTIPTPE